MSRPILHLESGVQVIECTGDADALEYGGGVIYFCPRQESIFWEFWGPRAMGSSTFEVFNAPVPDRVIEHFQPDLKELSSISGYSEVDIRVMSRSPNPKERAKVVMAICECDGPSKVDRGDGPRMVNISKMVAKWGEVFGVSADEAMAQISPKDYIARRIGKKMFEVGRMDGCYLGRFQLFDEVVQAVASACLTGAPNLYFEHGFGELEPVSWDRSDYPQTITANKGVPSPKWRNFVRSYSKMIVEPSKKKIVSKKGAIRSRNALGKRREREMERERIRGILYSGRS